MYITRAILIAGAVVAAMAAAGGVGFAASTLPTPDPGSGQLMSHADATSELRSVPQAAPGPGRGPAITRAGAEQLVLNAVGAPEDAPVFSELLSGGEVVRAFGADRSSVTDESRPIWVVTVRSAVTTDGGPAAPPQESKVYSAIVDAGSGQITDDCIGCSWLSSSK